MISSTISVGKMGQTLFDKIWNAHEVAKLPDGESLLYIDRHLVQEVSSPQAFAGLVQRGLPVRRPELQLAVADHAVSTRPGCPPPSGSLAAQQLDRLAENVRRNALPYIPRSDSRRGIVHVIGPELGFSLPGTTLVCGDSHTSTHGALGVLAFGIGTSQCETVLAAQALPLAKPHNMRIWLDGSLQAGVSIKDVILGIIQQIGTNGGQGYAIEYAGAAVSAMSIESRMTLCNMTIEANARIGMIAPDAKTIDYLKGRPMAPRGDLWDAAMRDWEKLASDDDAMFDKELRFDVGEFEPFVTWGTTPAEALPITGKVPDPKDEPDPVKRLKMSLALEYMGLEPNTPLANVVIDHVFIGSCTNGRLSDLRAAATILRGHRIAPHVTAIVVPGSSQVRAEAEAEGLDELFRSAGFEWRDPGCSMCVAMNDDRLKPKERCASTSNRNFQGRQGPGGRTHLMSPASAAAAAIVGCLADPRSVGACIYG